MSMKVIQNFLKSEELILLRDLCKTLRHTDGTRPGIYKCGTARGFGIEKGVPDSLYQKLLTASGLTPPLKGRDIQQFITYTQGGFIQPHKDWVDMGCNLYRVNIMIDAAAKGGELYVDGAEVILNEGYALVFRAEQHEHEVKPILEGSRTIFTIGFHHKELS